jgi:hypothetical protein
MSPISFTVHNYLHKFMANKKSRVASITLLVIPLVLSAYTHLLNPIGFPSIYVDEGHYMRRTMSVLNSMGPQDDTSRYTMQYDHPYFGQLFLASMLSLVGYPDSLHPSADLKSIELLHMAPRLLMGLLAIADTFLVYKVAERRYNNRMIGFIAGILFAVMPITWMLRRVMLESILLPLLLTSILFAVYLRIPYNSVTIVQNRNKEEYYNYKNYKYDYMFTINDNNTNKLLTHTDTVIRHKFDKRKILLLLISGIFLGLSIFTKIPVITMIPLVGFLVFTNSHRSFKALGIWFIPVILIPMIWPAYNVATGHFDNWLQGVAEWGGRVGNLQLARSFESNFGIDPVFLILGFAGIFYSAAFKKDPLFMIWLIPFFIYFGIVGYVKFYYWTPILPAFAIAAALMIVDICYKVRKRGLSKILPLTVISAIGIFGLISTTLLITTNLNLAYFEVYSTISKQLAAYGETLRPADQITLIGDQWTASFSWIPNDVLNIEHAYAKYYIGSQIKTITQKDLLIVDNRFKQDLEDEPDLKVNAEERARLSSLYKNSKSIASFEDKQQAGFDWKIYPYMSMKESRGIGEIDIRKNY